MKKKAQRGNAKATSTSPSPSPPAAALKLEQARMYLGGISVPTMHRLIHRGELTPVRKLRVLLFTIDELDRFLKT